ncbi:MAG: branched-chain amino acid ABC transporter permease [Thermodesulfobacteriota bacterium]|nr:branched-chain amino acid ABC transporter permease [Thermodesulfobacteriota bacterium]
MVNIDVILAQVFNGIQFGVLMALLATGLSLIFGMLGIINFAHGSLYMIGAYFVWTCMQMLNVPGKFWVGLIITLPLMAIVGLMIERFLLRWMYGQPVVYQILLTFGLLLVIQQSVALIYGTTPLPLGMPSSFEGEISLGLFRYPVYRLFTMILGLAIIFGVWYFIERSALGAIIRASAEDPETAKTLGVNTRRVYTWTFALGSALAGLGGGLHAPLIGGLQHTIGTEILLICFIVVVIGGMGSIRGALLGGIILGIVRGIAGVFWAPASDFVMFAAMGIILMIRPQGLLGRGGTR